jgi:hypothetical protein
MKNILYGILVFLIGCLIGYFCYPYTNPIKETVVVKYDTITKVDYIFHLDTVYVNRYIIKDPIIITKDSIIYRDSVIFNKQDSTITIPIQTKVFSGGDSILNYRATVSGFEPMLEKFSYSLINTTTTITNEKKRPKVEFVHGPNITAGYGLIHNNFEITVGYGVGLRF